ncbi:hypothetical protein [Massilia sp. Bi118]|uniref:hypothetical protein n=1 Tax=Massilia sp. Bi118 TaxID=2822346 RepID=UPI001E30BA98|nr:hypothetical protein [Massilia sp. Bi118]
MVYDIKPGETLNVWRGKAASQKKNSLTGHFLRGGEEQIVFNVERKDVRNDKVLYYEIESGKSGALGDPITQEQVNALKEKMTSEQVRDFDSTHLCIREKINHPNISGPFDTGWGYTEFDGEGLPLKIGLPNLPGQTTALKGGI